MVFPGSPLTLASFFLPSRQFTSDDLPTLERPEKATCGGPYLICCAALPAVAASVTTATNETRYYIGTSDSVAQEIAAAAKAGDTVAAGSAAAFMPAVRAGFRAESAVVLLPFLFNAKNKR